MRITKEEIQAYEDCRRRGNFNMYLVKNVAEETGLSKAKILHIMSEDNYSKLMKKHGIMR